MKAKCLERAAEAVKFLQKHGFPVRGYDIRPAAAGLAKLGGVACASAAEAAAGAAFLILMVVNAKQAEQALFENGALAAMPEGGVVILMATCSPKEARDIAQRVSAMGRRLIDAPVSGGVVGATGGTLTIMAGCSLELFELVQPLFKFFRTRFSGRETSQAKGRWQKPSINSFAAFISLSPPRHFHWLKGRA